MTWCGNSSSRARCSASPAGWRAPVVATGLLRLLSAFALDRLPRGDVVAARRHPRRPVRRDHPPYGASLRSAPGARRRARCARCCTATRRTVRRRHARPPPCTRVARRIAGCARGRDARGRRATGPHARAPRRAGPGLPRGRVVVLPGDVLVDAVRHGGQVHGAARPRVHAVARRPGRHRAHARADPAVPRA